MNNHDFLKQLHKLEGIVTLMLKIKDSWVSKTRR